MKFQEIFRFELAYQTRHLQTWLYFAVLFLFAVLIMVGSNPTDDDVLHNAPFGIAFVTVLGGAVWLLIAASVAGDAAARDMQTRMYPLTYTAPISKTAYLGGRFLAAFVLNALIMLAVPAGILFSLLVSDFEPARLDPFRPAAYLTAYGFIALPFTFVATAIQFSGATLTRRPMASYLASVLLFVAPQPAVMIVAQLFGQWELVNLLDLVGFAAIVNNLGDTWTAIEKNTRLVGLEGTLLANRLIWLSIAMAVLAFTHARFRFAHPTARPWWRRVMRRRDPHAPLPAARDIERITPLSIPQVRQTFGLATYSRQTLALAWDSFWTIAKSRSGLALLAAIAMFAVAVLPESIQLFGVPLFPKTATVLMLLTAPLTNPLTPWVIIPLLTVLYAGELAWREREAGLGEITDAAPVPEWVFFLGKFLGLSLVLAVWMMLLTTAGVLTQMGMGYDDFEIGLYLRVLFGLQLPDYLLFALLALVVQGLAPQKYVGHLVILVVYAFIVFASRFGIEHNLLIYGASPGWSYTDMRGFGASLGPWIWFKLYWAAWALLLAVVAKLLWVRGREPALRSRLYLARRRFTPPTAAIAATAAGLILTLGGFIFYNTNVLNEYFTASDLMAWRAEYERRYGQYEGIPQPRLTGTNLHVEIYPEQRAVDIRGTYHLVNRSAVVMDAIHLATDPDVETTAVSFDRPAALTLADEELGHRIYTLEEPLQPGAALQLNFEVHFKPEGFRNSGIDASVVANGTFFTNQDWLPAIGYQANRELNNSGDRQAHGLTPRPAVPSLYDSEAHKAQADSDLIAFDAVVGTAADQVAVAPGALRRSWMEDGRRYFHYVTDAPIRNQYAFFSANYTMHEEQWEAPDGSGQVVTIRIFHHPQHTTNLDRMRRSIQASLNYYTTQFGPYPYGHISLVQIPGVGGMHANTSLITFQEGFSLFNLEGNSWSPDFPFSVVAHEVAHQWWGIQLAPASVEGAALLSESLSEYSAFQVVKKTYGQEHLRRYLAQLRTRYETPRTRAAAPLLQANDPFQSYYKGPLALYALSEYIGEDRVNNALRRLIEQHGLRTSSPPTSLDLYRELQAVTPDSLQSLLHDLFEANTFWELETERASATQTEAGAWQVTLDVQARKVVVDAAGVENEVPMDDWVQIGIFAPPEVGAALGQPLSMQLHRIRSGAQKITVTVPQEPAHAGIDPFSLLIDLDLDDNIEAVRRAS